MKKIKNLLLCLCLSISFIVGCFVPCINVQAVGSSWSDSAKLAYFNNNFGKLQNEVNKVYFRVDDIKSSFDQYAEDHKGNYTTVDDLIIDNLNIVYQAGDSGNADISISQTLRQLMRDWCNAYITANTNYDYAYSFNTGLFSNYFDSVDKLNKFISFVDNHEEDYNVYFYPMYGQNKFCLTPLSSFNSYLFYSYNDHYPLYDCYTYKNGSYAPEYTTHVYEYDDSAQNWVEKLGEVTLYGERKTPLLKYEGQVYNLNSIGWCKITVNAETYKYYKDLQSLQQGDGSNPFYFVGPGYNTSISGSYNTTTNNVDNSITYNIIYNYYTDYHDENDRYPTPQEIFNKRSYYIRKTSNKTTYYGSKSFYKTRDNFAQSRQKIT